MNKPKRGTITCRRRSWASIVMTGCMVVVISGLICAYAPQTEAKELRPFTFILDYLPYGEQATFFTALKKGWYKEEGLDVKILRGQGSADTTKRIAAGQGDAGLADCGAVIGAIANQNAPVKAIAVYGQKSPLGIYVLGDSGINSIKDLAGKTISTTPGNAQYVMFPAVAKLSGLKVDSVKWVTMDATSMGPALITKRVDAAPFAIFHKTRLANQAKELGRAVRYFGYTDAGLPLYGALIIARNEYIEKDADTLRSFLRATIRSARYLVGPQRIKEGAQIVVEYNPEVDLEASIGAATAMSQLIFHEDVVSCKIDFGQFDPEKVKNAIELVTKFLELKRKLKPDELYTNNLLPYIKE